MGLIRVSDEFEQFIRDINKNMNVFLLEQGVPKKISLPKTTDMLFIDRAVFFSPEEVIKNGCKGKRLLFKGEIRL